MKSSNVAEKARAAGMRLVDREEPVVKVKLERLVAMTRKAILDKDGNEVEPAGALAVLESVKGLSARVGFKIAKTVKVVGEQIEAYQKAHNKLVEEMGVDNPKGRGKIVFGPGEKGHDPESWGMFIEQMDGLLAEEVELGVSPVELPPEFEGLTPRVLADLDGFIKVRD